MFLKVVEPYREEILGSKLFVRCFLLLQIVILLLLGVYFFYSDPLFGWQIQVNEVKKLTSNFGHNDNYFSSLLVLLIPFNLIFIKRKTLIFYLFILFEGIIIISLNSRASILALIIVLIYWGVKYRRNVSVKKLLAFVSLSSLLFLILIPEKLKFFTALNPMRALFSIGKEERLKIWSIASEAFKNNFLFGVGNGNWFIEYPRYTPEQLLLSNQNNFVVGHAHNLFVETGVELGFVGIVLLSTLFILFVANLIKNKRFDIILVAIVYLLISSFYGVSYIHMSYFPSQTIIAFLLLWLTYEKSESLIAVKPNIFMGIFVVIGLTMMLWFSYRISKINLMTLGNKAIQEQKFDAAVYLYENSYSKYFFQFNGKMNIKSKTSIIYWRSKKRKKAIEGMELALNENPTNWGNWMHLGNMYFVTKQFDKAKVCYIKSIELNKTYYKANLSLAKLAIAIKDKALFDQAIMFYDRDILPIRHVYESPELWYSDKKNFIDFLKKQCLLEDQIFELLDESNNTEFSVQ